MADDVVRAAHAIADAAARWRDADFPPRIRTTRAIRDRTGYTEPVVEYALDSLFGAIDAETILATIADELGHLGALDGFVSRANRPAVTYAPLARAAIVASDTTIGVALFPLIFALCAGCIVDVKDRDDRLVAEFLATLAQESPELAARATAAAWQGADDAAACTHLGRVDVALAFGSDASLGGVRAHLAPNARFVGFGHRTSVGYVARESLANGTVARNAALGIARDALLYDGEGCLSLHAIFVERDVARADAIAPSEFVRLVARACDEIAIEFPAGYATLDAAVATYAREARFRASQNEGATYVGTLSPHVVTYETSHEIAPPLVRRTLACFAVADPAGALAYLRRHALPLEALAFSRESMSLARGDLANLARASGAARIAELGTLQRPPLGGEHGGHGRILPFVRAIYRA